MYIDRSIATNRQRVLRLLPWAVFIAAVLTAGLAVAVIALTASASGVLNTRPGTWTESLRVAAGVTLDVNVPGALRLATSPLGRRLLDGHQVNGSLGLVRFKREGDALLIRCAPCRLSHPELSDRPVSMRALELRLVRAVDRHGAAANDRLDGRLSAGDVQVEFSAGLRHTGIEVDWSLPATEIAALYTQLGDAIPEARHARIEGRIAARGRLLLPLSLPQPPLAASTALSLDGFDVGGLATERLQHGWFVFACGSGAETKAVGDSKRVKTGADSEHRIVSGDNEGNWVALDAMGPWLPTAVLAAEDPRFGEQASNDANALLAVLATEPDFGGSVLKRQLVQNLFGVHAAGAAGRLRALLYSVEMERTLGKPRILELALNTAHWGAGRCGIKSAARAYFRKTPARLTPLEAAWLAAVLRAPQRAWDEQFVPNRPNMERARQVLAQLHDLPRNERELWSRRALVFAQPGAQRAAPKPAPSAPLAAIARAGG